MTSERHIVLGTGPLGQAVARELIARGQPLQMVNRSGRRLPDIPAGVEIVAADLYDSGQMRALAQGATVVYMCAQPDYTQWAGQWPPLMKSVLAGLAGTRARLIFGDNLYCYGDTQGEPLHEALPYNYTHTVKGRVRAEVADMALAAHRSGALAVAIGRGSNFYGPGVLSSTSGERTMVPALQGKPAALVGNIDLPHTLTYIDDFGKALVILGEREAALGQAWHVPNPPTISQRAWMTMVYEAVGHPPRMSGLGRISMAVGGLFMPEAREMIEMMYEFEKPYIVDHSKFARAFGDHSTPHREAVGRTVAWYRARLSEARRPALAPTLEAK